MGLVLDFCYMGGNRLGGRRQELGGFERAVDF